MIRKEQIFEATEGGKAVIAGYYPQSASCFSGRGRNFRIREDDKSPSCTVFRKEGVWFIQDKGGSDTKAYTAIQLVMREEGLDYPAAINWIARKYAPHLIEGDAAASEVKPMPEMKKVKGQEKMSVNLRKGGKFTDRELYLLGYKITPEICADLCLKPVDSYITAKNAKGESWQISSTDNYPIYYYDYGKWGKLYQPLGDIRFMYVGDKPEDFFFGEKDFIKAYADAKNGVYHGIVEAEPVDGEELGPAVDMTWKELIICSGPSDALNVHSAGYHVCWLNSETAELTEYEFSLLQKIAKKIYILYDIDDTGIANMYRIALRYLDINIIRLPEELKRFKDRKGKPCKDAKDFFVHFRRPENQNPVSLFKELVKLSGGLKFWQEKKTKTGGFGGYDINNEQLYSFLEASGYFRIATNPDCTDFAFCQVKDNVVTIIGDDSISAHCSAYLLEYLRTHANYYNQTLANTIHRSPQISRSSLEKLSVIVPDFNAFDEHSDTFFFNNGPVKVTATGAKLMKPSDCPYNVYRSKIIERDFRAEQPFFDIEYSEEYATLLNRLSILSPDTPDYVQTKKQVDALDELKKYRLKIFRNDNTFMRFVYNTGRNYWRKEELGISLTPDEQAETDLHFISKVMALGYIMSKHKVAGQPYAIYAMETEQSEEGTHLGGTGKSLFMTSTEQLRKQLFINGQEINPSKTDFMLAGVRSGITDTVYFDDLNDSIDLHRFMPMITGKMVVNPKNKDAFILEFKDSPKVAFTSNHAIKKFDASLRRRTWFTAFTDYYHSDDPMRGLKERSPYTEFHKNLIQDYSPDEMNGFYNFMFNCISVWHKLRVRIQPPMKQIEQRNLQRAITDEFIWWAEDWFTEERLDVIVNKDEAFDAYKSTLNRKIQDSIKMQTFKKKLIMYCAYKGWVFNPPELLLSETERQRNDIRRKADGKDLYFFYIDTRKDNEEKLDAASIIDAPPECETLGPGVIGTSAEVGQPDREQPPFI